MLIQIPDARPLRGFILMCLLLAGISVTAQRQNLLLESGFEGSSYLAGWTNNQHCCNYSVQQSTEQLKAGSSALRLEVRSSDPQTSSSIRSEITRSSDPLNADRWYGFSMYLKDWANDPAGEHVFQWHPDNSSGSSALSLWTSGGRFTIVTNNTGTSSGNVYNDIGPVLSNQWVDFVIRIRWSTATTGLLQVWRNGTLVVNKENVKTAAITNSFKLGINKYGWGIQTSTTTQRILFFDEVRIGNENATYNDVAPGSGTAPVNRPPVANAGADQTTTLPANTAVLSGTGSNDPDGTITTYAWSKISGPNTGTIATANTVTTNVTGLTQGVYRFRLQVTDNSGATAADTVQVTVNAAPNQPPVVSAGADQTIALPINSVVLSGSANDPDGTITTYAWSKISGPNAGTIATANTVTTNVTGLTQGVYRFRLQVTDNSGATAADTVQVTVNAAPNQPPVANAGADQTITLPINSVVLNGSANDPDGTITSYAWSKVSGPNAGTIATANAVTTNVTGLTQGVYRFRLQVTDNSGATADAIVQVTVNPAVNQPPVANAGDHQVLRLPVNYTQLDGRSSADTDGRIMSYRWAYVSGPANFILNDPAAALTSLSGLVEGVYVFRLTVTDDNGAAHADDVTITVLPPNQPPVAEAGNSIVMTLPTNATTLDGRVSYDPDGSIIRWQWTLISGPAAPVIVNPNAAVTAVNNLIQGTYSFRLTVTDDAGATDSDEVQVIVNRPANQLPIARAGNDITITLPVNQVQLDGAASYDPDGTIATFAWTRISGPADATIETPAAALTRINRLTQGTYIFRLTVTDNSGANASDDVVITVLPAPRVNQPPRAVAGADFTLSLPASAASLDGSASSDPDGQIVIHRWRQLSGPTVARITAPAAARTNVEGLLPGEYIFELTVTDNEGATASATAKINVVESILNLLVYPNPAANDLTLRYGDQVNGNVRVLIYDAEMRKVHERVVNKNQAMLQHTIDLRRLRSGTYFLRIITSDGRKIDRTFVKL